MKKLLSCAEMRELHKSRQNKDDDNKDQIHGTKRDVKAIAMCSFFRELELISALTL
jgi:hypothetical protein